MAKDNIFEKKLLSCHEQKLSFLKNLLDAGNIPHAFLFSGLKGIGKRAAAYKFAEMILSIGKKAQETTEDKGFDLFGEVTTEKSKPENIFTDNQTAEKIRNKTHLDLHLIEKKDSDKKNISIDDVREINKFLSLTPAESIYRVAIIDSIDDFNQNSSNAILKVLEEPTKNTVLIILCHSKATLLPTIKSRCIEVKFPPLGKIQFSDILSDAGYEEKDIDQLYDISEGSPGKAMEIVEKNILKTLKNYFKIINGKVVNLSEVISIAKEIKEKDSWKLFGNLFLKNYTKQIIETNDLAVINYLEELNKIIYFSEFSNMDIQDSLKNLTYKINLIKNNNIL